MNDLATFTFDVPQFHERSATIDGLQLIKGQFGVDHGVFLSMGTPSPDSASDLMTHLMQGCEVAHRVFRSKWGW